MSFFSAPAPDWNNETGCDPVEQILIPRTNDIGGFEVRRALPSRKRRMVGPFIFWDQMGPGEFLNGQGLDVRPHPHIALATVTYLFEGALDHKDSLGSDQTIRPGDLNIMKAGKGIVHSERTGPVERKHTSVLSGIQSWVALPKNMEESTPDFSHHGKAHLPEIEAEGKTVRLIMGSAFGESSPAPTYSDTVYAEIFLEQGAKLPIPSDMEECALYGMSGKMEIGGMEHEAGQILVLRPGDNITVKALTPCHIMLFGGATMDGERHMWWNFVHSDCDRIEQAKKDWEEGKFDPVPGDDEFIPLPE